MRDFEHRRCIEDVFCPHAPLRVFTKRKRSLFVKAGGFSVKAGNPSYKTMLFLFLQSSQYLPTKAPIYRHFQGLSEGHLPYPGMSGR